MTPTTRSGSKMRKSILQNIPENKEIKVVSSPKTPKKTPKVNKLTNNSFIFNDSKIINVILGTREKLNGISK